MVSDLFLIQLISFRSDSTSIGEPSFFFGAYFDVSVPSPCQFHLFFLRYSFAFLTPFFAVDQSTWGLGRLSLWFFLLFLYHLYLSVSSFLTLFPSLLTIRPNLLPDGNKLTLRNWAFSDLPPWWFLLFFFALFFAFTPISWH